MKDVMVKKIKVDTDCISGALHRSVELTVENDDDLVACYVVSQWDDGPVLHEHGLGTYEEHTARITELEMQHDGDVEYIQRLESDGDPVENNKFNLFFDEYPAFHLLENLLRQYKEMDDPKDIEPILETWTGKYLSELVVH